MILPKTRTGMWTCTIFCSRDKLRHITARRYYQFIFVISISCYCIDTACCPAPGVNTVKTFARGFAFYIAAPPPPRSPPLPLLLANIKPLGQHNILPCTAQPKGLRCYRGVTVVYIRVYSIHFSALIVVYRCCICTLSCFLLHSQLISTVAQYFSRGYKLAVYTLNRR